MAAPTESSTECQGGVRDPFEALSTFESGSGKTGIYRRKVITEEHVKHLAAWQPETIAGNDYASHLVWADE